MPEGTFYTMARSPIEDDVATPSVDGANATPRTRIAPLGSGPMVAELMSAPLFAQLRYDGPSDTLWRLTGT